MTFTAASGLPGRARITAAPVAHFSPKPSRAGRWIGAASKGRFTGQMVIPDGASGRIVVSESKLEILWKIYLLSLPEVETIVEQVEFEWHDGEKSRKKFFDIVIVLKNGKRVACEVKPEIRLQSGRVLAELRMIADQVGGQYDDVRVLTDRDLDRVAVHNAETFFAMRAPDEDADAAAEAVAAAITGAVTVRGLSERIGLGARGTRAIIRLLARRRLRLCRHERISLGSLVRRVEIV
ncbi:hypothetical protein [Paracoccus hibiscisoli]|uniref:hypothetical protein n=1 Tax=Paracoccus hibiscisoli TaxID=2023261 RepID=UPI0023F1F59D|nr:hypothetical protein [Paracoccus hibiscisoli]